MPRILAVVLGCLLAVSTFTVERHHDLQTVVASNPVPEVSSASPTASIAASIADWRDTPRATRYYTRKPLLHKVHHRTAPTPHATAHHFARSASVGAVPAVWVALMHCEGGDYGWHANTGDGYYGGLQITAGNAANYGFARPDLLAPWEQVRLGRLILRDQGVNAWPVCGPRVHLRKGD